MAFRPRLAAGLALSAKSRCADRRQLSNSVQVPQGLADGNSQPTQFIQRGHHFLLFAFLAGFLERRAAANACCAHNVAASGSSKISSGAR